jgi:hypothetical protein
LPDECRLGHFALRRRWRRDRRRAVEARATLDTEPSTLETRGTTRGALERSTHRFGLPYAIRGRCVVRLNGSVTEENSVPAAEQMQKSEGAGARPASCIGQVGESRSPVFFPRRRPAVRSTTRNQVRCCPTSRAVR